MFSTSFKDSVSGTSSSRSPPNLRDTAAQLGLVFDDPDLAAPVGERADHGLFGMWLRIVMRLTLLVGCIPACSLPLLLRYDTKHTESAKWDRVFHDFRFLDTESFQVSVWIFWCIFGLVPTLLFLLLEFRKHGELEWARLVFDTAMDWLQGTVAYYLALSYLLYANYCIGYNRCDKHGLDRGEAMYPLAAFLFVGLLRAHEAVSYPQDRQLIMESNGIVYAFRRSIAFFATRQEASTPFCCCYNHVIDFAKRKREKLNQAIRAYIDHLDLDGQYSKVHAHGC
jgi:hypothetical protein